MEEMCLYAETHFIFELSSPKQPFYNCKVLMWAISMHNVVHFIFAHREQINFKGWRCSGVV